LFGGEAGFFFFEKGEAVFERPFASEEYSLIQAHLPLQRPNPTNLNSQFTTSPATPMPRTLVEYDLGRQKLAFVDTPITSIVMPWEGGRLGFAAVRWQSSTLHLWSRDARPDGTAAWMERRVFDLKAVPTLDVVGFAEGLGVVFIS
jgi:hypothetical protein